jgi:hypothetical protein
VTPVVVVPVALVVDVWVDVIRVLVLVEVKLVAVVLVNV